MTAGARGETAAPAGPGGPDFPPARPKRVILLGSTGSIGENALRLFRSAPGRFEVAGLAAGHKAGRLAEQASEFGCRAVALADESAAPTLRAALPDARTAVLCGPDAATRLVAGTDADVVLCAIAGMGALRPVLAALESGKDVALSTKEVLVSAGSLVLETARRNGVAILPVDSEHSAVFQALGAAGVVPPCVRGRPPRGGEGGRPVRDAVETLWLTASGGPFFFRKGFDPDAVTPAEALRHPKWNMGPKVSVDSSTLMNKGLEIIEAARLFGVPQAQVGVLVHPQSVVHSLVEFRDGAQLAQLGVPDMRLPIQYALSWPERPANAALPRLDLARAGALEFHRPDEGRFPCLGLAREAEARGGLVPCAMNAADEVAVARFLAGDIRWSDIPRVVEAAMDAAAPGSGTPGLDDILEADRAARALAGGWRGAASVPSPAPAPARAPAATGGPPGRGR